MPFFAPTAVSSVTSTVWTPLMKCCRWPPLATTRYSFQSPALILAWISSVLPSEPVTSIFGFLASAPSLTTTFSPRLARMPRPRSS